VATVSAVLVGLRVRFAVSRVSLFI